LPPDWERRSRERVLFRDYLRPNHPEARRYEQLKQDLAATFSEDREAYSEGKTDYHALVVAKAKDSKWLKRKQR
jgi:GrpB-like predicted nucleotidyltransferase (UPF0157 family)